MNDDLCNCPQCQIERALGKNILDLTDEEIAEFGGCRYCAMTGFEDYPSQKIPCRLGHKLHLPTLPPLPEPKGEWGEPTIGGPWEWNGRGWVNLGYEERKSE